MTPCRERLQEPIFVSDFNREHQRLCEIMHFDQSYVFYDTSIVQSMSSRKGYKTEPTTNRICSSVIVKWSRRHHAEERHTQGTVRIRGADTIRKNTHVHMQAFTSSTGWLHMSWYINVDRRTGYVDHKWISTAFEGAASEIQMHREPNH